jgi:hypothetical protein
MGGLKFTQKSHAFDHRISAPLLQHFLPQHMPPCSKSPDRVFQHENTEENADSPLRKCGHTHFDPREFPEIVSDVFLGRSPSGHMSVTFVNRTALSVNDTR